MRKAIVGILLLLLLSSCQGDNVGYDGYESATRLPVWPPLTEQNYTQEDLIQCGDDYYLWTNVAVQLVDDGGLVPFDYSVMIGNHLATINEHLTFYAIMGTDKFYYVEEPYLYLFFDGVGQSSVQLSYLLQFDYIKREFSGLYMGKGHTADLIAADGYLYVLNRVSPNSPDYGVYLSVVNMETMEEEHLYSHITQDYEDYCAYGDEFYMSGPQEVCIQLTQWPNGKEALWTVDLENQEAVLWGG